MNLHETIEFLPTRSSCDCCNRGGKKKGRADFSRERRVSAAWLHPEEMRSWTVDRANDTLFSLAFCGQDRDGWWVRGWGGKSITVKRSSEQTEMMTVGKEKAGDFIKKKNLEGAEWGGGSVSPGRARSPAEQAEVRWSSPALWLVKRNTARSPPPQKKEVQQERQTQTAQGSDTEAAFCRSSAWDALPESDWIIQLFAAQQHLLLRHNWIEILHQLRRRAANWINCIEVDGCWSPWADRATTRRPGCASNAPRARWACPHRLKRWLSTSPAWTPLMRMMEVRWQAGKCHISCYCCCLEGGESEMGGSRASSEWWH